MTAITEADATDPRLEAFHLGLEGIQGEVIHAAHHLGGQREAILAAHLPGATTGATLIKGVQGEAIHAASPLGQRKAPEGALPVAPEVAILQEASLGGVCRHLRDLCQDLLLLSHLHLE